MSLQSQSWKRINYEYKNEIEIRENNFLELKNNEQKGLIIEEVKNNLNLIDKELLSEDGINEFLVDEATTKFNAGKSIKIARNSKIDNPVYFNYEIKANEALVDYNLVYAEELSEVSIILDYKTTHDSEVYRNSMTKIYAEPNSKVNVIKIQRLNSHSQSFDSLVSYVEAGAEVNVYSIELGSNINATSYRSYLEEDGSISKIFPVYLGDKDKKSDLEYSIIFKGRKSDGLIEGRGALKDKSIKVFRGNLYFEKGATHSVGSEGEFAILLDKEVRSHSIPGLFCKEDDVIGAHSASVGKVDEDKLFYLMSRGLSKSQSKKLIVESSFKPVLNKINDEKLKEEILNELDGRIS